MTQATALKTGNWYNIGAQRVLYLGERNGQARVSINGSERLTDFDEISLTEPDGNRASLDGDGAASRDPFQQLVDAAQTVRAGLERDRNSADARAATRKQQIRLLDRALNILTQAPMAPKVGKKHRWTDEQRASAAERMRARNAAKAEAVPA